MGKCKAKVIQTDLHTFRHNQAYPGIIQAYSKPCVTLAYLELWHIQNPINQHIQSSSIFRILLYSEPKQGLFRHVRRQTSTMKHFVKIAENSFTISAYQVLYFNTYHEVVTLEVAAILCKNRARVEGILKFLYT